MTYRYAVIGSGMQGTAEAYDLARFGKASGIIMADLDFTRAERAADRVNRLVNQRIAVPRVLDAGVDAALDVLFKDIDVCCGAAHYALNEQLTRAAIRAGVHFCDLGGNTGVVERQHELHAEAKASGVTIIPDCGLAPGLGNILAARAIASLDCDSVQIRCGGLPQTPRPPLGYKLVFSPAGLTNEYTGDCLEIRDGKIVTVPAFTELETIAFPEPVGTCEAFLTSGGTSTGPRSFLGKVRNYGYKTVRYPGHFQKVRAMIDLGFLDTRPVTVGGVQVAPRDLFHTLIESKLDFPGDKDLVVLRVTGTAADGTQMIQEMMDFHDDATGFSAMERTTAFSATIVAIMLAEGVFQPGVHALEQVVPGDDFVAELARRDIKIETQWS